MHARIPYMARRGRSRRSYAIEAALTLVVVVAIYGFLMNGGPTAFGRWYAGILGAPYSFTSDTEPHRSGGASPRSRPRSWRSARSS